MPVTCPLCGGSHPKWECNHRGVSGSPLPPFPGATSNPAPQTTSNPAPQTTSRPMAKTRTTTEADKARGLPTLGLAEAFKKMAPFPAADMVVLPTPGVTDKKRFDRGAYQREYMRKYRARKKERS